MKSANPETAVEVRNNQQPVAMGDGGLTIESAFHAVVNGELDAPKLEVMQKLLAMDAERKFNAAFVKMQSELPTIVASSVIPNRGKYERFEDIMRQIEKPLMNNGFSVTFSQDFKDGRVVVTCSLMHSGGHSRSNPYGVRVSGKADSETQADCKASTTAKRNALIQCLNITIRQDCLIDEDNDASLVGGNDKVTLFQSDELERRVQLTNSDVQAFLKFAGASKFSEIPANKYDDLDKLLARKEKGGR